MSIEERIREEAAQLEQEWAAERWRGIRRDYTAEEVVRLRGSVRVEHTLARRGAEKLWASISSGQYVHALGAYSGAQAVQMAKAGLRSIYLSGWQVAGDANLAAETYPDQSLYPSNSVPQIVKRINNALVRADQIAWAEGEEVDYLVPIVADAEAGFGGALNAFELMRLMIEAGAAGVHYEDQLAAEKKCGHLGGKVLVPTSQFVRTLQAARLAADVAGVPAVLVARTDALSATLLTSDIDPARRGVRHRRAHAGGVLRRPRRARAGDRAAARLRAVRRPALVRDVGARHGRGAAVRGGDPRAVPGQAAGLQLLAVVQLEATLSDDEIARFQRELASMGYLYQFVTLAGFHAVNAAVFELAKGYAESGMSAYVELQQREFAMESDGYTATRHQREVGAGYFDLVATTVSGGLASTLALTGSTEEAQFEQGLTKA